MSFCRAVSRSGKQACGRRRIAKGPESSSSSPLSFSPCLLPSRSEDGSETTRTGQLQRLDSRQFEFNLLGRESQKACGRDGREAMRARAHHVLPFPLPFLFFTFSNSLAWSLRCSYISRSPFSPRPVRRRSCRPYFPLSPLGFPIHITFTPAISQGSSDTPPRTPSTSLIPSPT